MSDSCILRAPVPRVPVQSAVSHDLECTVLAQNGRNDPIIPEPDQDEGMLEASAL